MKQVSEVIEGRPDQSHAVRALGGQAGEMVPASGGSPLDLPAQQFRAGLDRRRENRQALMEWVRGALVDGVDYGSIPTRRGPSKPSLWKPGAEKICGMLGVTVHFPTLHDYEQAALSGVKLHHIIIRCEIHDGSGRVVADGVGARALQQDYGDVNKALKMAEKSAHIDATLRMAGLSEVFTQDLEDMATEQLAQQRDAGQTPPQPEPPATIGQVQHRRLEARINALGLDRARVKAWVSKAWGVAHLNELPASRFDALCRRLEHWAEQVEKEEAREERLAIQTEGEG